MLSSKGGPASCLDMFHPDLCCVQDLHVCVFIRHHQYKRSLDVWIVGGEHQTPWTSRSHFLNTALIHLKNYFRGRKSISGRPHLSLPKIGGSNSNVNGVAAVYVEIQWVEVKSVHHTSHLVLASEAPL